MIQKKPDDPDSVRHWTQEIFFATITGSVKNSQTLIQRFVITTFPRNVTLGKVLITGKAMLPSPAQQSWKTEGCKRGVLHCSEQRNVCRLLREMMNLFMDIISYMYLYNFNNMACNDNREII